MAKKIIHIDGGIGRVISSTGAVRKYAENHPNDQIIVLTAWQDVFLNNPYVYKLYSLNHPYIWDDIVQYGEFIHLEPYYDINFYTQKHNLAQSFNWLLNKDDSMPKPEIYLKQDEKEWGQKFFNEVKMLLKKDKVGAFQPYGATAKASPAADNTVKEVIDESYRSLTIEKTMQIANACSNYGLINCSPIFVDCSNVANKAYNLRELFSMVAASDFYLGIDSSCLHVAAAFDKPTVAMLGATFKENVSYPKATHVVKNGFPKSYVPNRFSGAINLNKGATDYSEDEIKFILKTLVSFYPVTTPVKSKK